LQEARPNLAWGMITMGGDLQPGCLADQLQEARPNLAWGMVTMGGDLQPGCLADQLQGARPNLAWGSSSIIKFWPGSLWE